MAAWVVCLILVAAPSDPQWRDVPGVQTDDPFVDVRSRGGTRADVHEATHDVHSRLFHLWRPSRGQTIVYCLRGRGLMLRAPAAATLRQVAERVPVVLRGEAYPLYLDSQLVHWNDYPWYTATEAVCYANEFEWNLFRGYEEGCSVRYSAEFCVYLLQTLQVTDVTAEVDPDAARFVGWYARRTLGLLDRSRSAGWASKGWVNYLTTLRRHRDVAPLRTWAWRRVPSVAEALLVEEK